MSPSSLRMSGRPPWKTPAVFSKFTHRRSFLTRCNTHPIYCLTSKKGSTPTVTGQGSTSSQAPRIFCLWKRLPSRWQGVTAMLRLLPLSRREAEGNSLSCLPWEPEKFHSAGPKASYQDIWKDFLRGNYPELVANPGRDINLWHAGYVQTYLERDVRMLRQVGSLSQFQSFIRALAARTAQLLSLTDLAGDLGVAVNTVKAWLSVLEATYQVIVLRPYFANVGKAASSRRRRSISPMSGRFAI